MSLTSGCGLVSQSAQLLFRKNKAFQQRIFQPAVQDVEGSAESHAHIVRSMMQLASEQGISAEEGMGTSKDALTREEGAAANKGDTAADHHAPAGDGAPADETPPQPWEAEARHVVLLQTDTHQTDREEATFVARAASQASAEQSASQVPSDPLQAADKTSGSADLQATPTTKADMKETLASPQQSARGAARTTGLADNLSRCSADSCDPKDPYSISFKLQPWPLKVIRL